MGRLGRLAACTASLLALLACRTLGPLPETGPSRGSDAEGLERALRYLEATQVGWVAAACGPGDDARGWCSWAELELPVGRLTLPDLESGTTASVHHALAALTPARLAAQGLPSAAPRVERMRRRAAEHLGRFAVADPVVGSPAFGWWPPAPCHVAWGATLLWPLVRAVIPGPYPCGVLAPQGSPAFPPELRCWPDLDCTALAALALLEDARLDGGPGPPAGVERTLAAHRDLGPRRLLFSPADPGSGAFLTWCLPTRPGAFLNDLDLAVNANVLRALARSGHLEAAGARESTDLLVRSVLEGRHRPVGRVSRYYLPNHSFAYCVALAWREGPVPALEPAVRVLVADIEREAQVGSDGSVHWGSESPSLSTACAVLTLLLGEGRADLVEGGRRFLRATQCRDGGWPLQAVTAAAHGRSLRVRWRSRAMPTALALHALVSD